jgi:hypothetical protein
LLTRVRTADDEFVVTQQTRGPWIDLQRDGHIVCLDGTNVLSGTYTLTATGFTTNIRITTLVAYGNEDRGRLATIAAIGALTDVHSAVPTGVSVSAQRGDQKLLLTVAKYELTFEHPEPLHEH